LSYFIEIATNSSSNLGWPIIRIIENLYIKKLRGRISPYEIGSWKISSPQKVGISININSIYGTIFCFL